MSTLFENTPKTLPYPEEILSIIGPIIYDEDFSRLQEHRHHIFFNRYEHLMNASIIAYRIAKFFRADIETCVLAGLLHDYHFTTLKSYSHAIIAAKNAKRFGVSQEVVDIVKCHMYPLGRGKIERVRNKNFWVVKAADTIAATVEISYSIIFMKFSHRDIKMKRTKLLL